MSRLAALAVVSLLFAACAAPTAPSERAAPQEKQYGGALQYASQTPPDGLYWFDLGTIGGRGRPMASSQIWNGLINFELVDPEADYRADGKYAGELAESWSQLDPRTYLFNLRRGVKWHDGADFTSKDVVWSWAHWGDRTSDRRLRTVADNTEKIEAVGTHQVRLVLKKGDPDFLTEVALPDFKILPAHVAENAGNPTGDALKELYEKTVIGTGPMKLRTFDRRRHLETERFEDYWRGRPYLDGTRCVFGLERSGVQAAFIARELDFASLDDRVQFDTIKGVAPDTKRMRYISAHNWGLQFNVQRKPFEDVRVRRAVHLAMDRQKLQDAATFGEGLIPAPAPILPTLTRAGWGMPIDEAMKLPGWRQPKEQDLAEAKRLLAEAGYPNGFKTAIIFRRGISHPTTQTEPVASQLKAIGIEAEAKVMEPGLYADQVYNRKDFEVINDGMTAGYAIASTAYSKFHSKGASNYGQVNDPELDRLIEAAMGEPEREKRNQLFIQMQRIITDKVYYAPIVTLAQFVALQPWVYELFPSQSVSPELLDAARLWMDVNTMPEGRRKW